MTTTCAEKMKTGNILHTSFRSKDEVGLHVPFRTERSKSAAALTCLIGLSLLNTSRALQFHAHPRRSMPPAPSPSGRRNFGARTSAPACTSSGDLPCLWGGCTFWKDADGTLFRDGECPGMLGESLYLNNKGIKALSSNVFANTPGTTKLYLQSNGLERMDVNAFIGLQNLKELQLGANELEHIDSTAFGDGLPNLETLNISKDIHCSSSSECNYAGCNDVPRKYSSSGVQGYSCHSGKCKSNEYYDGGTRYTHCPPGGNPLKDLDGELLALFPKLKTLAVPCFNGDTYCSERFLRLSCLPMSSAQFSALTTYQGPSELCDCDQYPNHQADGVTPCVCKAGHSGANNVECSPCAAGTYKSTYGSTPCANCPENSNAPAASRSCRCDTGYGAFSSNVSTPCTPCLAAAGFFCPPESPSAAGIICPAGFYCLGGVNDKKPCPHGTFTVSTGSYACIPGVAVNSTSSDSSTDTPTGSWTCEAAAGFFCSPDSTSPSGLAPSTLTSERKCARTRACV